jgi:hypothetical protein
VFRKFVGASPSRFQAEMRSSRSYVGSAPTRYHIA